MASLLLPSLLLILFSSPAVLSAVTVTHLPGFTGALPFHLETGYVRVDEVNGVELFYYFLQSERNPREDPLILWLTGGPGCSAFSGLVIEIGPIKFVTAEYNGSLPSLVYNQYSWTKITNIVFLDSPVGTGFSFSRNPKGYLVDDITSSKQIYEFLRKWLVEHPQFLSNHLYIAGDSYAGKIVPVVAYEVAQGIEAVHPPLLNLKGYLIGNPLTGELVDMNSRIPYARGVGIISDELYELRSEIWDACILDPKCLVDVLPKKLSSDARSLQEKNPKFQLPSGFPDLKCRSYAYFLSYYWANNYKTREALHIKKGTVREWARCNNTLAYTENIPSSVKYQINLTKNGYRALVYSGDKDMSIPFIGTQAWIRSLNFSIVDDWRSWRVDDQVAGYTRKYSNNLTFATVKDAGHTAPEYKPESCFVMLQRWISHEPL